MKLRALIGLCLMTGSLLLAGCGGIFPTPTPTPTATPLPTNTPTAVPTAPPTATRPKPTATKENTLPSAIAFALNKTQNAHSMKFEFASDVTLLQGGQTKKVPGLAIKGEDSTLNRQVTISGTTNDTNEFITYEVVVLGNDVYIKGLTGNGLNGNQWYKLPEEAQAGVRRLPTARGLIASFAPEDVAKALFKAEGSETLDDQTCSVWSAQAPQFAQALIGVTAESELKTQLGEIDKTEFKLWTCADGFIHLMMGQVHGHDAANKENQAEVSMRFQMNDFESALDIRAPADAIPFPSGPQQAEPTSAATEGATPEAAPSPTGEATQEGAPSPTGEVTQEATVSPTEEATQEVPPSPTGEATSEATPTPNP